MQPANVRALLLIVLAACFFLIFCQPRHVARHHVVMSGCTELQKAYGDFQYTGFTKRDAFVSAYPVNKQRHVLECIGD